MKKRKTTPNGTAPEVEPDGSLDALDSLAAEMEQAAEDASPDSADDADGESFEIPEELPILPLKDIVVYPFAVVPLGAWAKNALSA